MRIDRCLLMLALVLMLACSANAQQRAPAGGAYYNGHFYKGGQFMPNGAFGGFPDPGMQFGIGGFPQLPANLQTPKTSYRRAARTKARTSARHDAGAPIDQASVAVSRLNTAKNLWKIGKREQARGWLRQVSEMNASAESSAEACRLLCELDDEIAAAGSRRASVNTN
jgi:hypothetical protein